MQYFQNGDILNNEMETHPFCEFFIYQGKVYLNNQSIQSGAFGSSINHVPVGYVSLYEENVDRPTDSMIYPFVIKGELQKQAFKTISYESYSDNYAYGDIITGSYPLSASISIEHMPSASAIQADDCRDVSSHLLSLENTLNYYAKLSPHYLFSSSLGDKNEQQIALISIPSIFYGSSIEKGSVHLKWFVTGSLIGELNDIYQNGTLVQVGPSGSLGSGSIAGVVLYNEGFILLTGSWDLHSSYTDDFGYCPSVLQADNPTPPAWRLFGSSINALSDVPSSSFALNFNGTQYVPVTTLFCHANMGELNDSCNPTFVEFDTGSQIQAQSGSSVYYEPPRLIKNITSSSFPDPNARFQRTTYISRIAIYDENKKVIAYAKLAVPVKKTEERNFTFKLVYDW